MARGLKGSRSLQRNWNQFPTLKSCSLQPPIPSNSSSWGSNALFWPSRATALRCTTPRHRHMKLKIKIKKGKIWSLGSLSERKTERGRVSGGTENSGQSISITFWRHLILNEVTQTWISIPHFALRKQSVLNTSCYLFFLLLLTTKQCLCCLSFFAAGIYNA